MTDFDTCMMPGHMISMFDEFNTNFYEGQLKLEENEEKKWVKIVKESKENEFDTLVIKVRWFDITPED